MDEVDLQEVICFGGSLDGQRKRVDVRNWGFKWHLYPEVLASKLIEPENYIVKTEEYDVLRAITPRGTVYYIAELHRRVSR